MLSPLRESPLESVSYAEFVDWGIPLPELQVTIHDEEDFVGRVDFLWRDSRVIRELGYIVVRRTWDELMNEPWKVRLRDLSAAA